MKRLTFFMTLSLVACFLPAQEADAEEVFPTVPMDTLKPAMLPDGITAQPQYQDLLEVTFDLSSEEPVWRKVPLETEWPVFPDGRRVAFETLEGRYAVGKKAVSLIYHPNATLSFKAEGSLKHYMNNIPLEEKAWGLLEEEEKVEKGFQFAESIIEDIRELEIPHLPDFLTQCLVWGRQLKEIDSMIKDDYHLHLKYSNSTFRVTYKDRF